MYLEKGSYNTNIGDNSTNFQVQGKNKIGNIKNIGSQNITNNLYETYENDSDLIILIRNSKRKKAEIIDAILKILGIVTLVGGLVYWMVR